VEQTNGAAMKWKRGRTSILFWRSSWRRWKEEDRSSHSPERRGHNNRIQRSTERCLCSLSLSLSLTLSLYVVVSVSDPMLSLFLHSIIFCLLLFASFHLIFCYIIVVIVIWLRMQFCHISDRVLCSVFWD